MFIDKFPKFAAGRVLKHDMLNLLRDYPRDHVDILYSNYADGIFAGCSLRVNTDTIRIAPGIVRHRGKLYTLQQSITVSYTASGQDTMVKILFGKEKENGDYIILNGDVIVTPSLKTGENELELCRFRLKPGARLRDDYQNFADLATEYDTINIISVPFAAPYENTLSPVITRRFAQEALQSQLARAFDYVFISQCAQGQPVARMLITAYTAARLGIVTKDSTNQDMHRHLARILDDLRQGKDMAAAGGRGGGRKILVD